jgi:hypothetical protein
MDLLFGFSRYPPTYMMRKGQVAGSSCPFSFLCLYLIICIGFDAVLLSLKHGVACVFAFS